MSYRAVEVLLLVVIPTNDYSRFRMTAWLFFSGIWATMVIVGYPNTGAVWYPKLTGKFRSKRVFVNLQQVLLSFWFSWQGSHNTSERFIAYHMRYMKRLISKIFARNPMSVNREIPCNETAAASQKTICSEWIWKYPSFPTSHIYYG